MTKKIFPAFYEYTSQVRIFIPESDVPLVTIYAQVSQGFTPVIRAEVVAVVTYETDKQQVELRDNGAGL